MDTTSKNKQGTKMVIWKLTDMRNGSSKVIILIFKFSG